MFEAWGVTCAESENNEKKGHVGELPEVQDGWIQEESPVKVEGQKGQITENPDQKYAEGLDFILTAVALSQERDVVRSSLFLLGTPPLFNKIEWFLDAKSDQGSAVLKFTFYLDL